MTTKNVREKRGSGSKKSHEGGGGRSLARAKARSVALWDKKSGPDHLRPVKVNPKCTPKPAQKQSQKESSSMADANTQVSTSEPDLQPDPQVPEDMPEAVSPTSATEETAAESPSAGFLEYDYTSDTEFHKKLEGWTKSAQKKKVMFNSSSENPNFDDASGSTSD